MPSDPSLAPVDTTNRGWTRWLTTGFGLVLAALAAMWAVEIIDVIINNRLEGGGIHPRRIDGLDGVLWAPFLHDDFGHLISNTVPFLVLGGLLALRGVRVWVMVTAIIIVVGGLATWVFARSGNHIGASGVVFGYLGFLVAAAVFERSLKAIAIAVLAGLLYGGLIFGILPSSTVSWEGHLFGALAGAAAAWLIANRGRTTVAADTDDPLLA